MEDQFGGRTDDDLFYDDFEPVESEPVVTEDEPAPSPQPAAPAPIEDTQPAQAPTPSKPQPGLAKPSAPKGLASSRHAEKPPATTEPAPKPAAAPASAEAPAKAQEPPSSSSEPSAKSTAPPNAPTAPKEKPHRANAASAHLNNPARLQSGANPRQKLTEDELSVKMEKMKLLSAEKTRKFEKAEKDEKQHAEAYARGMEQARKRKVEAEERRKRGEENQRKLDDERAKNRERKLKAMGMKEGGWDEGKEALAEEESRRGFKGANGGVRGARRGGLGDSRHAVEGEETLDVDRFLDDRHRGGGRGRGRGRGGAGRGGRGGQERGPDRPAPTKQSVPSTNDFPALPAGAAPSKDIASDNKSPAVTEPITLSPAVPGGKWDDEMEALDALKQKS